MIAHAAGAAIVQRHYVASRDGQLHYRIAGDLRSAVPPLLCCHQSPMTGRIFERLIAEIGRDRLGIAPDTPGFGMSDGPATPPEIEDYAQAMSDLIDSLGLTGPIDLIGYHTGAKTVIELALLRPDVVRRVIMISAPIYTAAERAAVRARYHHRGPQADGSHLAVLWQGYVYWNLHPPATLEELAEEFPDRLMWRGADEWGHRAAFNHRLEPRLPLVRQPVLVLNPKDDIWDKTRRAAGHLNHGRILDLPGWAHGFLTYHPAEAATLLRSFLDAPDDAPFGSLAPPPGALIEADLPTRWADQRPD